MTTFWSLYISILSLGCWLFVVGALVFTLRMRVKLDADGTTGHDFDGVREYDKPMPRWWLVLFWATIVWAAVYAFAYPALGNNTPFVSVNTSEGPKPWSSANELQQDLEVNNRVFTKYYNTHFAGKDAVALAKDPKAVRIGEKLFLQNCAMCHGSAAQGAKGYPNLTDKDWLYGGTPTAINETLTKGRLSDTLKMPAWISTIGAAGVNSASEYVLSLSAASNKNIQIDANMAAQGKLIFEANCAVCHGADAKGNQGIGAPNLTDNIWLYGNTRADIRATLRNGRSGQMPKWDERLGEQRIQLLTSYVYSLSN